MIVGRRIPSWKLYRKKLILPWYLLYHMRIPMEIRSQGTAPRETYDGYGEISDVCLKRKIRNRLMDFGQRVFVQSDDRSNDGYKSLKERADANPELKKAGKDKDSFAKAACQSWIDVRSFGQVFAFKGKGKSGDGVSVGVRGPVSIHSAFSVDPIISSSLQITKSVNGEPGEKKASDTMGMKHRVDFGLYVTYGSINCQLAEKTGFTSDDAELIKKALHTLFENDVSSARPDGSMEVVKLYWWTHNCKDGQYSSAKVHRLLHIVKKDGVESARSAEDYQITCDTLPNLDVEVYDEI